MSMVRFASKLAWLGFMPALTALPVNNPMDICLLDCPLQLMPGSSTDNLAVAEYVQFRAGFFGNYVFDRHLEEATLGLTKDVQTTTLMTNGGFFAFDLFNHLTLYGRLGATNLHMFSNAAAFNQQGDARVGKILDLRFATAFSWNLGGQMLLLQMGDFACNLEAQFFKMMPEFTYATFEGSAGLRVPENTTYLYTETQVSLGCSYNLNDMVVPFAAFEWANVHTSGGNVTYGFRGRSETMTLVNLKNAKPFSYTVGTSVVFTDAINITAEGRFAGEKAFTAMAQFLF